MCMYQQSDESPVVVHILVVQGLHLLCQVSVAVIFNAPPCTEISIEKLNTNRFMNSSRHRPSYFDELMISLKFTCANTIH